MLADIELPASPAFTSHETREFLREVSGILEDLNVKTALSIENGSLSHPDMDGCLINLEQTNVQSALNELKMKDPEQYQQVVAKINSLLNVEDGISRAAGRFYGSDAAYQRVLDGVRSDLGSSIDFGNQSHREAIGHALVEELDRIKDNRPDGWSGCDAAGCTWNEG